MNNLELKPFTKEQVRQLRRENFEQASNPSTWMIQSQQLWKDARTLWNARAEDRKRRAESINCMSEFSLSAREKLSLALDLTDRSAFILMGLAIENAMKGLFVAEFPEAMSSEKLEDTFPKTGHDLLKLKLRLACINDIEVDQRLLNGLSDHLYWLGKYPVPKNKKDIDYQLDSADFGRSEVFLRCLFNALVSVQVEKQENHKMPD